MREGRLIKVPLSLLEDPRAPLRSVVEQGALDELMQSMSRRGLLQPIGAIERDGRYEVVWGHRRTMAARELGWPDITARLVVRDAGGMLLDRAHENLMRADLSPVEEGQLCEALLKDAGDDIGRVARSIGRSVGWVQSRLDLLLWPEDLRTAVDAGEISRAAARPLAAVTDDHERAWLLRHAINDGASERVTRAWYTQWQLSGHIASPDTVAAPQASRAMPPMDPTWPCFFCGSRYAFSALTIERFCAPCLGVIAANRPDAAATVGEELAHY